MSEILKDDPQGVDLCSVLAERGDLSCADALHLVSRVAEIVRDLHQRGRLHGGISTRSVFLEPSTQKPTLLPPRPVSSFGGAFSDEDHCPLELRQPGAIELPSDLEAARRIVADAAISLDPRQIDIYQLGTLLCRLVTGESVSAYLSSPRAKAGVPPQVQSPIDRALGYESDMRFTSVGEFLSAIDLALEHFPSDGSAVVSDREAADARHESPDNEPAPSQRDTSPSMAVVESQSDTNVDPRRDVDKSSDADLPFRTLGHYQITGRIGHGGMGDVYKAFEKKLNRTVAIKVLPVELAREPDFVRRFYAEASAAANLVHPNIIQIYFIGEESGRHFFAMQCVDGESLAEYLARQGRLGADETLVILEQALSGLAAAHQQGMVHRDIKPGNLLLDRVHRRVLLADFGLVKLLEGGGSMTATGTVMGTADYISPEQGRGQKVDARSDLYSIGVLTYRMLCGRLPFEADSTTAMIFQHVYEPPAPLEQWVPDIPRSLSLIVETLLSKSPDARHQSAREVLADLWAFRHGQPLLHAGRAERAATPLRQAGDGGRPQTAIIQSPSMPDAPLIPQEMIDSARTVWWQRARDQCLAWFQARTPELAERLQNTEQHVAGAVAEYGRRHEMLGRVVGEAESVLEELRAQAEANRRAAASAAQRAREAEDEVAAKSALHEQRDCENSVDELEKVISQQESELEDMRVKLAQVSARLNQLRSQRDQLNARLRVAQARVQQTGGKPAGRRRAVLLPVALSFAIVLFLALFASGVVWLWRIGIEAVSAIPSVEGTAQSDAIYSQGYDPDTWLANDQTPPADAASDLTIPSMPLRQLIGHAGFVYRVAFNREDTLLASSGSDSTLRIWDAATGREIRQLSDDKVNGFGSVAFSPDGRMLAATTRSVWPGSHGLTFWDVSTGAVMQRLGKDTSMGPFAFHPTKRMIAAFSGSSGEVWSLALWDYDTGERVAGISSGQRTTERGGGTVSVAFSPDGRFLAFPQTSESFVLWDLEANAVAKTLEVGGLQKISVTFSPDSRVLIAAGTAAGKSGYAQRYFSQARAWNVTTGKRIGSFNSLMDAQVNSIAFHPDGKKLAIAGDNAVRIWHVREANIAQVFQGHEPMSIAFSHNGSLLASGGQPLRGRSTISISDANRNDVPNLLLWRVDPE